MVAGILVYRDKSSPSTQIRVGLLIARSGYAASFGPPQSNAVQMLRERFPNVEFIIEDNRSDPKAGISGVRKLIDIDKVDIVYCDLTTVVNAILPITDRERKVVVASVYLKDLIQRSSLTLRNLPSATEEAEMLLDYAKRNGLDLSRTIALGSNDEFGRGSISDFKAALSRRGGQLFGQDYIPDSEQQIALFASKVVSENPTAIYAASLFSSLGLFIKEVRLAGFTGPVLTTDAYVYNDIRAAAGVYGKGTIYPDYADTTAKVEFIRKYRDMFGTEFSSIAGLVHDGLAFILSETPPGQPATPEVFTRMSRQSFQGVLGEIRLVDREYRYPLVVRVAE